MAGRTHGRGARHGGAQAHQLGILCSRQHEFRKPPPRENHGDGAGGGGGADVAEDRGGDAEPAP